MIQEMFRYYWDTATLQEKGIFAGLAVAMIAIIAILLKLLLSLYEPRDDDDDEFWDDDDDEFWDE